jgi:hypothetical protein
MFYFNVASQIFRRYALAWCCVILPIAFGFAVTVLLSNQLVPNYNVNSDYKLDYKAVRAELTAQPKQTTADSSKSMETKSIGEPKADIAFLTPALHIAGRIDYAVASAFLLLAGLAAFGFGAVILFQRLHWLGAVAWILFFGLVAKVIAWYPQKPPFRELVVERLLNKADVWVPDLKLTTPTGEIAANIVAANTFLSLWPVGVVLAALWAVSIRPLSDNLDRAELEKRRLILQIALGLASALLVCGVLAQKTLMAWPLSLIQTDQANGLKPLADALTLQFGAMSSIALIGAFGPAITAWTLDAARLEQTVEATVNIANRPAVVVKTGPDQSKASQSEGKITFAPLSLLSSLFAVLAPLLASPFVEAFKNILAAFAR